LAKPLTELTPKLKYELFGIALVTVAVLTLASLIGLNVGPAGVFVAKILRYSFGAGALISKKTAQEGDVVSITGYQLLFGGLVLVLIGLAGKGNLPVISASGFGMLIYLALLSAVSFTIWTVLLKYNGVGKITVYNFLIPIFGVILSAVFLGESILDLRILAALLLVCAGIFIINAESGKQS
jgi:drug/metabolite transporter (DMT)-like permease